jgi:hypothetical protein
VVSVHGLLMYAGLWDRSTTTSEMSIAPSIRDDRNADSRTFHCALCTYVKTCGRLHLRMSQVKRKFWPAQDVVKLGALSDHWPVWLSLEMESL